MQGKKRPQGEFPSPPKLHCPFRHHEDLHFLASFIPLLPRSCHVTITLLTEDGNPPTLKSALRGPVSRVMSSRFSLLRGSVLSLH